MLIPTDISREIVGTPEHLLLQADATVHPAELESLAGQAACVYIDPPFMTGNSFKRTRPYGAVGWQKGTPYLDWVKAKLHEYADYSAVLLVHSFLEDNGTLTANGKLLEKSLLPDAKNLRLILCGHKDGSVRWQKTYDDNTRTVNAVMYNFQDDKQKGLGYLRILTFDPVSRSIHVSTYSPYLDDYNYYQEESLDSFTLYNAY